MSFVRAAGLILLLCDRSFVLGNPTLKLTYDLNGMPLRIYDADSIPASGPERYETIHAPWRDSQPTRSEITTTSTTPEIVATAAQTTPSTTEPTKKPTTRPTTTKRSLVTYTKLSEDRHPLPLPDLSGTPVECHCNCQSNDGLCHRKHSSTVSLALSSLVLLLAYFFLY